ncbi:hypothetical protein [Neobacillus sp. YIM B06451]|uniref:hypothetical protein n=1 Tax=Neobacillus sp. YIM B06451 TaxID=3070994 RepID=UPI00292DA51A|nr:hypothetical protein [Neobacillus sp. YIM B06451]
MELPIKGTGEDSSIRNVINYVEEVHKVIEVKSAKEGVNTLKKAITIGLLFVSILLSGCNMNKLSSAEFTNLTPAIIKIDNLTYLMTDEVIAINEVEEQIGKINRIQEIVSYSEDQNPYKSPSKIFKVKDINIEEAIAIKVNDKLYKANSKQ